MASPNAIGFGLDETERWVELAILMESVATLVALGVLGSTLETIRGLLHLGLAFSASVSLAPSGRTWLMLELCTCDHPRCEECAEHRAEMLRRSDRHHAEMMAALEIKQQEKLWGPSGLIDSLESL